MTTRARALRRFHRAIAALTAACRAAGRPDLAWRAEKRAARALASGR